MLHNTEHDARVAYTIARDAAAAKNSAYGESAVKKLAEQLNCTAALLYSYAPVAEVWDESAFNAIMQRRNSKGRPLAFSHLVAIAKVCKRDVQMMNELLERTFNESLSYRALLRA